MDKYPKYISEGEQELFERYLMSEMPVAEQLSFKAQLADNEDLNTAFEEFKTLFETVEEAGLRRKMDDFHKEMDKEDTSVIQLNTSKSKFNYRVAASVTILLAIGAFWFLNRPDENARLFDAYYTQDPGLPTVMGSTNNYDFYEAMVDYKRGNYDIAISKWEKLLVTKPENDTLNYFLGSAYLANDQTDKAIRFFDKTIQTSASHFEMETYYYLGLIYLKSGNLNKALEVLGSSDLKKAKELYNELNSRQ